jgi:hypothetical protein
MTNLTKLIEQRQGDYWHMKGLAKSESAKDAGEMTVVKLGYVTTLQKEAYRQALEDVLAGLPGEVSVYPDAHIHMTDRELRDEEMRVFGMNYRLKTVRAQIEGLLGNIKDV